MFTGIVEEIGVVGEVKRTSQGVVLSIGASGVLTDSKIGDSIAIDGVCLTMTQVDNAKFTADVTSETLRRTTLGDRIRGDGVNLERSLQLNSRLGGHIVLGHVDDVGVISDWKDEGDSSMMRVSASPDVMRYVVFKGSICVDGISLTIANLFETAFEIALIPHTKRVTTIGKKRAGDRVNLEVDLLGRYVEKLLGEQSQSIRSVDFAFLKSHGFA
ncbi:MAG: riboflavin synthase [Candidatus Poribacteria bacterium]|nr:riboflavin synthase [Candidatus Poribacteria bacterium]MDE0504835.1 riboflavin synthase [Candidatus Poribacteria bacterium]